MISEKVNKLVRKLVGRELGKTLIAAFFASVIARLSQLFMAILLAKNLTPANYGIFVIALSGAIVAGRFSGLGIPALIAKLVPSYKAEASENKVKGILIYSGWVTTLTSILIAIIFYLSARYLNLSEDHSLALGLGAVMILPMAWRFLLRRQLAAFKMSPLGISVDEVFAPLAVVLIILLFGFSSLSGTVTVYVSASVAGVLLGLYFLSKSVRKNDASIIKPSYETVRWAKMAMPFFASEMGRVILNRTDFLLLGPLASLEDVGLYGASIRLALLLAFVPYILSTVLQPKISELHANSDRTGLIKFTRLWMTLTLISSLVLATIMFFGAELIITIIFGEGYKGAIGLLRILAVAQFFAAISSVHSGVILMMNGASVVGKLTMISVVLNVLLNLYLIPRFGAQGAAYASLLLNVLYFIAVNYAYRKQIRLMT